MVRLVKSHIAIRVPRQPDQPGGEGGVSCAAQRCSIGGDGEAPRHHLHRERVTGSRPHADGGAALRSDEAGVGPIHHLVEGPVPQPIDLGDVVAAGAHAAKDNTAQFVGRATHPLQGDAHRAIGERVRGRKADDEPDDMQAIGLEGAGGIEAPARAAPRGGERVLVDDALGWRRGRRQRGRACRRRYGRGRGRGRGRTRLGQDGLPWTQIVQRRSDQPEQEGSGEKPLDKGQRRALARSGGWAPGGAGCVGVAGGAVSGEEDGCCPGGVVGCSGGSRLRGMLIVGRAHRASFLVRVVVRIILGAHLLCALASPLWERLPHSIHDQQRR